MYEVTNQPPRVDTEGVDPSDNSDLAKAMRGLKSAMQLVANERTKAIANNQRVID